MIRNQWYGILESKEIKKNKPIGVTRMGEKLVLWRDDSGNVNCIFDRCCHRGASLSTGTLVDNIIRCPFHGFAYDGTGKVIRIPANGKNALVPDRYKVNAYVVKEQYGFIWLWYGAFQEVLPEIPFF
ncbi:MAG: aromatic ring-hydroxylating dioxygenase subunit alpha, partial [Firmicutes bacterium]|nr:aromatic ring-hydroxylating dioxygenase subunit alpha [Bacillota bacterium]